ncbi:hypothetical protein QA596_02460 [Balneolales bacterium ANBcel1]|nr:hypothetical protein [Balneolales bacterium ANBcel1]
MKNRDMKTDEKRPWSKPEVIEDSFTNTEDFPPPMLPNSPGDQGVS